MRLLKVTEEYRAESEQEVKEMNEQFKNEAKSEGYILNAFSYAKKEIEWMRPSISFLVYSFGICNFLVFLSIKASTISTIISIITEDLPPSAKLSPTLI